MIHQPRSVLLFFGVISGLLLLLLMARWQSLWFSRHAAKPSGNTLAAQSESATRRLPVRLRIPEIFVDAAVQSVGITPDGSMGVPNNIVDVGWFNGGPRPGEKGSAVIAGHLDGELGEAGVFANLSKLKTGDIFYVEDDKGKLVTFIVRELRRYDPGNADDVFNINVGNHLNLITCDGFWDKAKNNYTKRLVVFADSGQ